MLLFPGRWQAMARQQCSSVCGQRAGLTIDGQATQHGRRSLQRLAGACRPAQQQGLQVFAARHGKRVARLGRPADQRKALVRALTTQVLDKGKIRTTAVRVCPFITGTALAGCCALQHGLS